MNAITPTETDAIIALFEKWGQIDRSHRKLAHRGSWLGLVYVSPATVRRVLQAHELVFRFPRRVGRSKRKNLPDWVKQAPNQVWIYDTTHWDSCDAATTVILDLVSRKWVGDVTSVDETSTEVQAAFDQAIKLEGLEEAIEAASGPDHEVFDPKDPDARPVLIAMSDNGSPMRSESTLVFMSMAWIGTHFGRPGTPTDQAWIETHFGHLKEEFPYLDSIGDVAMLRRELVARREHYNGVRLHQGIGYVTPDQEHEGLGEEVRQARRDGLVQAAVDRVVYHRESASDSL
jgi:transposase InsO family protein